MEEFQSVLREFETWFEQKGGNCVSDNLFTASDLESAPVEIKKTVMKMLKLEYNKWSIGDLPDSDGKTLQNYLTERSQQRSMSTVAFSLID